MLVVGPREIHGTWHNLDSWIPEWTEHQHRALDTGENWAIYCRIEIKNKHTQLSNFASQQIIIHLQKSTIQKKKKKKKKKEWGDSYWRLVVDSEITTDNRLSTAADNRYSLAVIQYVQILKKKKKKTCLMTFMY